MRVDRSQFVGCEQRGDLLCREVERAQIVHFRDAFDVTELTIPIRACDRGPSCGGGRQQICQPSRHCTDSPLPRFSRCTSSAGAWGKL
eukprot:3900475-Pyramimonas_sp.AAC.1